MRSSFCYDVVCALFLFAVTTRIALAVGGDGSPIHDEHSELLRISTHSLYKLGDSVHKHTSRAAEAALREQSSAAARLLARSSSHNAQTRKAVRKFNECDGPALGAACRALPAGTTDEDPIRAAYLQATALSNMGNRNQQPKRTNSKDHLIDTATTSRGEEIRYKALRSTHTPPRR